MPVALSTASVAASRRCANVLPPRAGPLLDALPDLFPRRIIGFEDQPAVEAESCPVGQQFTEGDSTHTRAFDPALRNFWLVAMVKPVTSIVPSLGS
jgi:hypothetical protein